VFEEQQLLLLLLLAHPLLLPLLLLLLPGPTSAWMRHSSPLQAAATFLLFDLCTHRCNATVMAHTQQKLYALVMHSVGAWLRCQDASQSCHLSDESLL
jgi:hypothetical protein